MGIVKRGNFGGGGFEGNGEDGKNGAPLTGINGAGDTEDVRVTTEESLPHVESGVKPPSLIPHYPEIGGPLLDIPRTIEDPIPEVEWAIQDLISIDDIFMLSGPGGLGKTYILMAMAIALATGRPLFGLFHTLRPFNVLYIDEEMSIRQVKRRFSRMLKGQHFDGRDEYPTNLHVVPEGRVRFDGSQADHRVLKAIIEERKIEVMLVDSVRRTIAGDENDSRVANLFFSEVKPLRDAYGLMCGFIGHWNKDSNDSTPLPVNARFRGSTDWINLCDSHIAVLKGAAEHQLTLEHGKSRHEIPLDPFGIRFMHDNPEDPNTPFWLEYGGLAEASADERAIYVLANKLGRITREDAEVIEAITPKRRRAAFERLVAKGRLVREGNLHHGRHVYRPKGPQNAPTVLKNAQKEPECPHDLS